LEGTLFFVSGLTFWPVSRNMLALFENKRVGLFPLFFVAEEWIFKAKAVRE